MQSWQPWTTGACMSYSEHKTKQQTHYLLFTWNNEREKTTCISEVLNAAFNNPHTLEDFS